MTNHPIERVGEEALRWSLVAIFFLFGIAKFAAYEAEGVAGIAQNYWLFSWLYPLGGVRFASNVIGTLELSTGLLLALGSRFGLASLAAPDEAPAEVVALAEQRQAARAARDFERADRLRSELEAAGWEARDEAEGYRLVRLR